MKKNIEPDILRRCMKSLGYTNQSLADELSAVRSDGARTSAATVSRWISGAASPEPSLVLYLRERMRSLMKEHQRRTLPRTIWVGVNGYKGGCGNSSMTNCLTVAAHQFGFKVGHVVSHRDCHNYFEKSVGNLAISDPNLKFFDNMEQAIIATDKIDFDYMFVDLPRDAFSEHKEYDFEALFTKKIDALVCPISFASSLDYQGALKSLKLAAPIDISRRIIVPFAKSISLIETQKSLKEFAKWEELFHYECILFEQQPFDVKFGSILLSINFKDDYSWYRYLNVIDEVVRRSLGFSLEDLPNAMNMNLSELTKALA